MSEKEFEDISKKMKIFLFAASNKVYSNSKDIVHIKVEEVTEFIKIYKHILPNKIKLYLE